MPEDDRHDTSGSYYPGMATLIKQFSPLAPAEKVSMELAGLPPCGWGPGGPEIGEAPPGRDAGPMSKACTLQWHRGGMLGPGSHRTNDRVWISF